MIRSRLTYANVVSTLCLFIVLGGSAYAAKLINGKQLKNGTVAGKKLKRNTLGGREVRESRLATVPRATAATRADSAARADEAARLGGLAASAFQPAGTKAADSEAVDGLDSTAFLRGERVLFGTGNSSANPQVELFTITGLGLKVTTDGDADSGFEVGFENVQQAGGNTIDLSFPHTGGVATPSPGNVVFQDFDGAQRRTATIVARDQAVPARAAVIHCGSTIAPNILECFAIRSPGG